MRYLVAIEALGNLQTHDISHCSGSKIVKFSILPFNRNISSSVTPFNLIHFDVHRPYQVSTKGMSLYYISFIDYYTHYCSIKNRSKFLSINIDIRAFVKTQLSTTIKCFRCDLDGEYTSFTFSKLFTLDETIHESSCTNTLKQNGVTEKKHRHIIETARSLLLSGSISTSFGERLLSLLLI